MKVQETPNPGEPDWRKLADVLAQELRKRVHLADIVANHPSDAGRALIAYDKAKDPSGSKVRS